MRSPRLFVTLLGLAALGLVASLSPPASAQGAPSPQQIKEAAGEFDLGIKAAQNKDFESAASHFENADRMAPSADAVRAAIRARRDAKQGARAATLAAIALAHYPDNKDLAAFAQGVIAQQAPLLHSHSQPHLHLFKRWQDKRQKTYSKGEKIIFLSSTRGVMSRH